MLIFISPIFYVDQVDSFLLEEQKSWLEDIDSLHYSKPISVLEKYDGIEFAYQDGDANYVVKCVTFLAKDRKIALTAYLPKELLYDKNINTFFKPVALSIPDSTSVNIFQPSAGLIFKDLMSSDSATFEHASDALDYHPFQKENLPQILAALEKDYSDDYSDYYTRTKNKLIDTVVELDTLSLVPFLMPRVNLSPMHHTFPYISVRWGKLFGRCWILQRAN